VIVDLSQCPKDENNQIDEEFNFVEESTDDVDEEISEEYVDEATEEPEEEQFTEDD
jgi:hypothetical protein